LKRRIAVLLRPAGGNRIACCAAARASAIRSWTRPQPDV